MGQYTQSHASVPLSAPQALTPDHITGSFDCGNAALNRWLSKRALYNQGTGASRTFVVCDHEKRVLAFYALATGAVAREQGTDEVGQDMPDPIPVILLGRLGVTLSLQRQGLGSELLRDALLRVLQVKDLVGVRAVLVHAKDDRAEAFYASWGFKTSPVDPLMLMVTVSEFAASVSPS